jgi:hypothetical protein
MKRRAVFTGLAAWGAAAWAQQPPPPQFEGNPGLALLYSLEVLDKKSGKPDIVEVNDQYAFTPGDLFHLRLTVNCTGFLYLYRRSAAEGLVPFYPLNVNGSAAILEYAEYVFPRDGWFRIDRTQDPDEIWAIFSKQPMDALKAAPQAAEPIISRQERVHNGIYRAWQRKEAQQDLGGAVVTAGANGPVLAHRIVLRRAAQAK